MNVCTLLILFWQHYKRGRERERGNVFSKIFSSISDLSCTCYHKDINFIFPPSGKNIYTMKHVDFWGKKYPHFKTLSAAKCVIHGCEEAKIRCEDYFPNRFYCRFIAMNKNNAQKILISPVLAICVCSATLSELTQFFFNSVHLVLMVQLLLSHQQGALLPW